MSTDFDLDLKVDIEDRALGQQTENELGLKVDIIQCVLGQQKMNWVFMSTLFNAF
jgi:hypothetical protein